LREAELRVKRKKQKRRGVMRTETFTASPFKTSLKAILSTKKLIHSNEINDFQHLYKSFWRSRNLFSKRFLVAEGVD